MACKPCAPINKKNVEAKTPVPIVMPRLKSLSHSCPCNATNVAPKRIAPRKAQRLLSLDLLNHQTASIIKMPLSIKKPVLINVDSTGSRTLGGGTQRNPAPARITVYALIKPAKNITSTMTKIVVPKTALDIMGVLGCAMLAVVFT